jgi:hypothetical protein
MEALHVMDQEADDYDVLAALHRASLSYVIRGDPMRQTTDARLPVKDMLARQPGTVFRTVPLNPRSAQKAVKTRGRHPERAERLATLHVRWATVTIKRRQYSETRVPTLTTQAVHVVEPAPPPSETPIEWMLVTSEPVRSLEDGTAVVDHYRARWLVEEYFKALNAGCAFEKRQLTDLPGLDRALAVFVPLAWRLLLRHLGRAAVPTPVDHLFDAEQVLLLRKVLKHRGYELPRRPTMRDAMLGIAALGGHIKDNGTPGWLVLGRGLTRFLEKGNRVAPRARRDVINPEELCG